MPVPTLSLEPVIAGVDEAGRGCLAGPVYAAAVVLDPARPLAGLNDSKKLGAARRETLFGQICSQSLAWGIASADADEIDRLNIEQASWLAMRRAVQALALTPDECWVDGNRAPRFGQARVRTIVGGDALEPCIMAASILAKVARDRELLRLDAEHPGYGFARHKAYGTLAHRAALARLGPTSIHRMSFKPCRTSAEAFPQSPGAQRLRELLAGQASA